MIILDWLYFLSLILLIPLPVITLFIKKNIYSLPENILIGMFTGILQFFLLSYIIFIIGIPTTVSGWIFVYSVHILITIFLYKLIKKRSKKEFNYSPLFFIIFLILSLISILYLFQCVRKTFLAWDSRLYYFFKGWVFYNTKTIKGLGYLVAPRRLIFLELIYNFFITFNSGIGVSCLSGITLIIFIFYIFTKSWKISPKYTVISIIPFSLALFVFFGKFIYWSYGDIFTSIVFALCTISLSDLLFCKEYDFYSIFIFFLSLSIIKHNGYYLIIITIINYLFWEIVINRNVKKSLKITFFLFFPILILTFINGVFLHSMTYNPTLRKSPLWYRLLLNWNHGVLSAPSPYKAFIDRLKNSIRYFLFLLKNKKYYIFFIFFVSSTLLITKRVKNTWKFITVNIWGILLFIIIGIYSLCQNNCFKNSYWRTLSHLGCITTFSVYSIPLYLKNISKRNKNSYS